MEDHCLNQSLQRGVIHFNNILDASERRLEVQRKGGIVDDGLVFPVGSSSVEQQNVNQSLQRGVITFEKILEASESRLRAQRKGNFDEKGPVFLVLENVLASFPPEEAVTNGEKEVTTKTIRIPYEKMRHVVGKRYANVDRLEEQYGVRVIVPEIGEQIVLKGTEEQIKQCETDIRNNMPFELTYEVERRFSREFRKYVIDDLERDHNVHIEFEREKFTIAGKRVDCTDVLIAIKAIVATCRESNRY